MTTDGVPTAQYVYDTNGNRTGGFTLAGGVSASYDAQDRLLNYNQRDYTYTANGELSARTDTGTGEVTQYDYDVLGNLLSVTQPDGTLTEYVIDARNRRVGKKVGGVEQQRSIGLNSIDSSRCVARQRTVARYFFSRRRTPVSIPAPAPIS